MATSTETKKGDTASTSNPTKPTRYIITAPIKYHPQALASDPTQILHVPKGPTHIIDPDTGEKKRVERKKSVVKLVEGEGFTDDILAVNYLQEQWGGVFTVTAVGADDPVNEGLGVDSAYRAELEELKAQAAAQQSKK